MVTSKEKLLIDPERERISLGTMQLCSFLLGGSIHPQQPEPRIESFSPLTTIIFRGTGSS